MYVAFVPSFIAGGFVLSGTMKGAIISCPEGVIPSTLLLKRMDVPVTLFWGPGFCRRSIKDGSVVSATTGAAVAVAD